MPGYDDGFTFRASGLRLRLLHALRYGDSRQHATATALARAPDCLGFGLLDRHGDPGHATRDALAFLMAWQACLVPPRPPLCVQQRLLRALTPIPHTNRPVAAPR